MNQPVKVTAIVGSYRRGGVIDSAVDEILAAAREEGADAVKINLIDRRVEFCTNCRACTQPEGTARGRCVIDDEMSALLDEIERSDALVLASPMNFWTVTAVMKRFIERLVCYAYWPWGGTAPKYRSRRRTKYAVVVGSSAAPALLVRLITRMVGLLKSCAALLGVQKTAVLFIGGAAEQRQQALDRHTVERARRLGRQLVARCRRHHSA